MRVAAIIMIVMGLAAPAVAAGNTVYERCVNRADGIASRLHDCEAREALRLDGVLKAKFEKVTKTVPVPLANAWRQAQRAWVPYRKAACELSAAYEQNGLGVGMWVDILYGCDMEMSEARTIAFGAASLYPAYHSATFDECVAKNGQHCAEAEAVRLDDALNAAYRALVLAIRNSDQERLWRENYEGTLRKSERSWLIWRDVECTLAGVQARHAGRDEIAAQSNCRLALLSGRVHLLKDHLEDLR